MYFVFKNLYKFLSEAVSLTSTLMSSLKKRPPRCSQCVIKRTKYTDHGNYPVIHFIDRFAELNLLLESSHKLKHTDDEWFWHPNCDQEDTLVWKDVPYQINHYALINLKLKGCLLPSIHRKLMMITGINSNGSYIPASLDIGSLPCVTIYTIAKHFRPSAQHWFKKWFKVYSVKESGQRISKFENEVSELKIYLNFYLYSLTWHVIALFCYFCWKWSE